MFNLFYLRRLFYNIYYIKISFLSLLLQNDQCVCTTQRTYAHRRRPHLLVQELQATNPLVFIPLYLKVFKCNLLQISLVSDSPRLLLNIHIFLLFSFQNSDVKIELSVKISEYWTRTKRFNFLHY